MLPTGGTTKHYRLENKAVESNWPQAYQLLSYVCESVHLSKLTK